MGNKNAQRTNQLLGNQTKNANAVSMTAQSRGDTAYNEQQDTRNFLNEQYRNLYNGTLNGGDGGGGGVGYTPAVFTSTSLPFYSEMMNTGGGLGEGADFYRNLMKEGGYSDTDRGNIFSAATAPITGMFEGLRRSINTASAGGGYGSNLSRLARDQAYQAGELSKSAAADLADRILSSKERGAAGITGLEQANFGRRFQGAGGVTGLETERRNFDAAERARAASAAAAGRANSRYNDQLQLEYLSRLQSLMPEDLPYMDRQLGGGNLALGTITSRKEEPRSGVQNILANVSPLANMYMGGSPGQGQQGQGQGTNPSDVARYAMMFA